jgi:hypothetical protein
MREQLRSPEHWRHSPEHWRRRAREARTLADGLATEANHRQMLAVAENYMRMADEVEEAEEHERGVRRMPEVLRMPDGITAEERYRQLAAEARAVADAEIDPYKKRQLMLSAQRYDTMADRAKAVASQIRKQKSA